MYRLHRTIREIDAAAWNRLAAGNAFASHGWLLTAETTCRAKFEPLYVAVWKEDVLVATSVCYVVDSHAGMETLDDMVFGRLAGVACGVGLSFLPGLVCGPLLGYAWHAGGEAGLALDAMEAEARSRRLDLSFTLVLDTESELQKLLAFRGYSRCRNVPVAILDVAWDSFDQYLEHLPRKTRKEFRRQINRNRHGGCVTGRAAIDEAEARRLLQLVDGTARKHSSVPFPLDENFYGELQRNLEGQAWIFTTRKKSLINGSVTMLVEGDSAYVIAAGVDHESAGDDFTYFQVAYNAPDR